jgi:hypothetical protein
VSSRRGTHRLCATWGGSAAELLAIVVAVDHELDEWQHAEAQLFVEGDLRRGPVDALHVEDAVDDALQVVVGVGLVLDKRRPNILVDATAFKMDPAKMDLEWRNVTIIPKYNQAGVERFAFHVPPGMPAVGAPPAPDGPADFPTAWFATRREAIAWLRG